MNYRHAYHAGNFADVLKHVILARVLTYMKQKALPFRIIDLQAGAGRYDLSGIEAGKTGEWLDGIRRLLDADLSAEVQDLLAPYLDAVAAINPPGVLQFYPGSPLIVSNLMRAQDVLIANELHPDDAGLLKSALKRGANAKVTTLSAWTAIKSLLPPQERRGVVLIDPPFEEPDEFGRITQAVRDGLQRFATGVYIVWYPIKDRAAADQMVSELCGLGCRNVLDARLRIADAFPGLGLTETGVVVLNPPFTLAAELAVLLPALTLALGQGRGANFSVSQPCEH